MKMDQSSFKIHFFTPKYFENLRATDESQAFAEMYDTATESIRYLQHVFRTVHSRNSHNTRTTLRQGTTGM